MKISLVSRDWFEPRKIHGHLSGGFPACCARCFDSQKNTGHETVRTECSKITLSVWFFIFFLIINLSNLYDRAGGILNLKSLICRFNVTCGAPEN